MSVFNALSSLRSSLSSLATADPARMLVPLMARVLLMPLIIIARQIGFILLLAGGALFLGASLIAAFFVGIPLSRSFGTFSELTRKYDFTEIGLK